MTLPVTHAVHLRVLVICVLDGVDPVVNDGEDVVAVAPLDVVQVCARLRQMLFPPEAVAVVVVGQLMVQLLLLLLLPAHPLVGAVDRSCHHKFRVRGRSRDLLAPMDLDS